MVEWLSLGVTVILPLCMAVIGWIFNRIVHRIDSIDKRVTRMATSTTDVEARLVALEKTSLTRDDLRDVIETALAKSVDPITQELKAICASSQKTRERLVRLEATFEARSD